MHAEGRVLDREGNAGGDQRAHLVRQDQRPVDEYLRAHLDTTRGSIWVSRSARGECEASHGPPLRFHERTCTSSPSTEHPSTRVHLRRLHFLRDA